MGIKYRVNEQFFDKWTRDMAYILGYIYADGSLEDASYLRGKYIRASSVDKSLIMSVKKALGSDHPIVETKNWLDNRKTRFLIRIGSKKMYASLEARGLCPKKSLIIGFPQVPDKYLADFIRGYFDGDGCVYLEMTAGKQNKFIIKKLSTIFTSGSDKFLKYLGEELRRKILVKDIAVTNSHRSFQLRYSTEDSGKIFKFIYGSNPRFFLKRKLTTYLKYFKLRPVRVDRQIKKIIKNFNYGHVVK